MSSKNQITMLVLTVVGTVSLGGFIHTIATSQDGPRLARRSPGFEEHLILIDTLFRDRSDGALLGFLVTNPIVLLRTTLNQSVADALQITATQKSALTDILSECNSQVAAKLKADVAGSGPEVPGQSLSQGRATMLESLCVKVDKALNEILLPHQVIRLRQIGYRSEIQQRGLGEAFTTGELARDLTIYDNQKTAILAKGARLEREIAQETRRIREAALQKLIEELSPEQRAKAQELLGDPVDVILRTEVDEFRRMYQGKGDLTPKKKLG